MSFTAARSFATAAGKLLSASRQVSARVGGGLTLLAQQQGGQTQRGLTRSLWYMCSNPQQRDRVARPAKITKMCGCCGLHTEGDKEIAEFLTEEIKLERDSEKVPGKLPRVKGFDVESDGASVTLTKKSDNETVCVKFNVNHTVDDESSFDYEKTDDAQAAQMVSRPPFIVEINKGGEFTLGIQCTFPPAEDMAGPEEGGQQEQFEDVIEIQEVALLKGEWEEKVYSVSGSILDGNLYDMLLNLLEERGIGGEFVDQLVAFSTAFEHKKYIGFLEQLKDFSSK